MTERSPMTQMTLARVTALIDAYGGDPARWPDDERDAALALCDTNADAARLRDEARALDRVLAKAPDFEATPALAARVAEIPARAARDAAPAWSTRRAWAALLAGVTFCVLGIAAGTYVEDDATSVQTASETVNEAATDANDTSDDGAWDDLAAIALARDLGREP